MRVGPSGSDGRVRVQTTGSCSGTTAGVVSVPGKGGTRPVRCVLGRRTGVNRWYVSKANGCHRNWALISGPGGARGKAWLMPEWWPALRRREPSAGSCVERGNLCRDVKGDLQMVDP